jgi:hypothetical protein
MSCEDFQIIKWILWGLGCVAFLVGVAWVSYRIGWKNRDKNVDEASYDQGYSLGYAEGYDDGSPSPSPEEIKEIIRISEG